MAMADGPRCGICGSYLFGDTVFNHRCGGTVTFQPVITPLGWKCPICQCGVAPWQSTHCEPSVSGLVGQDGETPE